MPQLIMSPCEFAGDSVTVITATVSFTEADRPRRVVAFGRISRCGVQVAISDCMIGPNTASARVGR